MIKAVIVKTLLIRLNFLCFYGILCLICKGVFTNMSLLESGEMYLETIYTLSNRSDFVRSIDICEEMGFSKPSVSRAMKLLKADGYIEMEGNGRITLTQKGLDVAAKIYNRHTILTEFFLKLGISENTAVDDACKIEHVISDESMDAIKKFIEA